MQERLLRSGSLGDWDAFAASWGQLGPDPYLALVGRDRRRRHAVFTVSMEAIAAQAPRPHHQDRAHNPLQGGIERTFEPLTAEVARSASLRTVLLEGARTFAPLTPSATPSWNVEVHQFRIEARQGKPGTPTPEGMHRDGVDHVLVLMIHRENIREGTTSIHARDRRWLGEFTLTEPFDAALVDDERALHAVTPVQPVDADRPAFRDVLVVTYARRR